jgi:polysaccharide chain length determinant protein (PEP-CTERM system associated)
MHAQLVFILGEIRSALRYRWLGLGLAWLIALAGWVYVAALPDIFEADTRFYVDTSSMLGPVLRDRVIEDDPEAQLAFLREALLGRAQLEAVARDTGLDAAIDSPMAYEGVLNLLRNNVRFDAINTAAGARSTDQIYDLRFRHQSRDKALDVVEAFRDSFIESAIGEAREEDDQRIEQINALISEREQDVRSQEREIADFKRQNADRLPGEEGAYLSRRQAEMDILAERRRALRSLESSRTQQQQQIEGLREQAANSSIEPPPNSVQARIRDAELELDELLTRNTEAHRDVIAQRQLIARLRAQLEAEREARGADGTDLLTMALETSPVYQEAQIELLNTNRQIAVLTSEISEREADLVDIEAIIDESLAGEVYLSALTSSLGAAKDELNALTISRQELVLTQQTNVSSRMNFRSINDPNVSLFPVEPARLKLALAVFMVALGAGAAACYLLAQVRPVFNNAQSLREFAELPVLGTVTNAWPAAERSALRRSILGYSFAALLLFVAMGGVAAIEVLGPGLRSPFAGG